MNISIQSYDYRNNHRPSFGSITQEAKEVINSGAVRTILKKKYGIGAKEIRKLDESSLKFALLSDSNAVGELSLPSTSGLVLIPYKGSKLPKTCITSQNYNLYNSGNDFFAFCVKKAVEMEKLYRTKLKDFSSHPVNKAWREKITEVERPLKLHLKKFVRAYNGDDRTEMSVLSYKLKTAESRESKIDLSFQNLQVGVKQELAQEVSEGWEKINQDIYVPNLKRAI